MCIKFNLFASLRDRIVRSTVRRPRSRSVSESRVLYWKNERIKKKGNLPIADVINKWLIMSSLTVDYVICRRSAILISFSSFLLVSDSEQKLAPPGKSFPVFFPFFHLSFSPSLASHPIFLSARHHMGRVAGCRLVRALFFLPFFPFYSPQLFSLSPLRALTTISTVSAVVASQTRSCHLGSLSVSKSHTSSVCHRVQADHTLTHCLSFSLPHTQLR